MSVLLVVLKCDIHPGSSVLLNPVIQMQSLSNACSLPVDQLQGPVVSHPVVLCDHFIHLLEVELFTDPVEVAGLITADDDLVLPGI